MSSVAVAPASTAIHVAPVTGWRRLARDLAAVGGSTAVCHLLGVANSLLLRAALSPSQMGVWQGLKLLLGYANYANLGASKGAARELSIALGHGDMAVPDTSSTCEHLQQSGPAPHQAAP